MMLEPTRSWLMLQAAASASERQVSVGFIPTYHRISVPRPIAQLFAGLSNLVITEE